MMKKLLLLILAIASFSVSATPVYYKVLMRGQLMGNFTNLYAYAEEYYLVPSGSLSQYLYFVSIYTSFNYSVVASISNSADPQPLFLPKIGLGFDERGEALYLQSRGDQPIGQPHNLITLNSIKHFKSCVFHDSTGKVVTSLIIDSKTHILKGTVDCVALPKK